VQATYNSVSEEGLPVLVVNAPDLQATYNGTSDNPNFIKQ